MIKFLIGKSILKQLEAEKLMALRLNNFRLFRAVQAMIWLGEGKGIAEIVELIGITKRTFYNWLKEFFIWQGDELV